MCRRPVFAALCDGVYSMHAPTPHKMSGGRGMPGREVGVWPARHGGSCRSGAMGELPPREAGCWAPCCPDESLGLRYATLWWPGGMPARGVGMGRAANALPWSAGDSLSGGIRRLIPFDDAGSHVWDWQRGFPGAGGSQPWAAAATPHQAQNGMLRAEA